MKKIIWWKPNSFNIKAIIELKSRKTKSTFFNNVKWKFSDAFGGYPKLNPKKWTEHTFLGTFDNPSKNNQNMTKKNWVFWYLSLIKKLTHKVSFSFCNSSTCCLKTAMTSLEAAASSCTACKSSFILISSRSVTASLEDLPRKLEPLTDPWAANGGVWCPETNPAELLDFLSLRDLLILLKALGKNIFPKLVLSSRCLFGILFFKKFLIKIYPISVDKFYSWLRLPKIKSLLK